MPPAMLPPNRTGLQPTLRQMIIVVLWSALLVAPVRLFRRWGLFEGTTEMLCLNVAFLIATWPMLLLGVLLILLDRRNPVRPWYFSCCLAAGGFSTSAGFLLVEPICWAMTGHTTQVWPLLPLAGLICLLGAIMQTRVLWPGRCERCESQTVVATGKMARRVAPEYRNRFEGWCARCGATSEREKGRPWQLPAAALNPTESSDPDLHSFRDPSSEDVQANATTEVAGSWHGLSGLVGSRASRFMCTGRS